MAPKNSPTVGRLFTWLIVLGLLGPILRGQSAPVAKDPAAKEEVVSMEAFRVSTSLGNYAETTSTTAMKMPIEIMDLPATVQVLNSSFIIDHNADSLNDVYSYVVGMTRFSTSQNDYTMRGFAYNGGTPQTLHSVLVEGLPGVTSRWGSPSTANVERVEVLKGPSSLLYGRIQPGGLINTVTKRPLATKQASFFATVGTYDGRTSGLGDQGIYTGTVDFTGPVDHDGHVLYRMIANYNDLNSFRTNVFVKNYHLFPSLTYRWSKDTELTVEGEVARQVFMFDGGLVAPFNNIFNVAPINTVYQEKTDIEHDSGDSLIVLFKHQLHSGWALHASARSTWAENHRAELNNNTLTNATPVQNTTMVRTYIRVKNSNRFNWFDANVTGETGPENFKNTIIAGLGGGVDFYESNRPGFGNRVPAINIYNFVLGTVPYPPDGTGVNLTKTTYNNYDAYASDLIKFGKHLRAFVGFRYDRQQGRNVDVVLRGKLTTQTGDKFEPQAGLLYDVSGNLSFYASYAESYFPNSLTAYDANDLTNWPPQTASQIEFGVKGDYLNHRLTFSASAYEIKQNNVLETVPNSFTKSGNPISILSGTQEVRGLEVQSSWLPMPHWQFQVGYSYIPTALTTKSLTPFIVGLRLANSPVSSGSFWSRYNIPQGALRGVGLGVGVIYQGPRNAGTTAATFIRAPGYTRVDTGLYYRWKRYDLAVNVENTLDQLYFQGFTGPTAIFPGAPRKIVFSIKTQF